MEITQSLIESLAPNPAAVQNGRKLVQKGSFIELNISADVTLIFGQCTGSGKTPYRCSVDFVEPAKPVFRCTCPSRQFPCKHCIGLMLARAGGTHFTRADIPADVADKRAKLEKRAERVHAEASTPVPQAADTPRQSAVRRSAGRKKIDAQLQGLHMAAQLLGSMVQMGLGTLDVRMRKSLTEQIKALGNHYIPGVQAAFNDILLSLNSTDEQRFVGAIEGLTYLHALIERGLAYLPQKQESGEMDTASNIEELLGHAWKLEELRACGCTETDVSLVQLCFHSYDQPAAKQEVQEGVWLHMGSGRLFKTRSYRPYRAAKYIKAEDTVFDIVTVPELFIYPGHMNPRVRWNESRFAPPQAGDFAAVRAFAQRDYAAVIRGVKNQLKSPLADKNPVALLHIAQMGRVTGENGSEAVIRDAAGNELILLGSAYAPTDTVSLLTGPLAGVREAALLALFSHDLPSGRLTAMPLALVLDDRAIRLLY